MCYSPKHIVLRNNHPTAAYPEAIIELDVPCGHCVSCLKRRQTDYATRLYNECKNGESMYFVTLTYRENTLPIALNYSVYDLQTGERVESSEPEILSDMNCPSKTLSYWRGKVTAQKISSQPRYYREEFYDSSKIWNVKNYQRLYCEVTPSLNRKDVSVWIKKCRIQYERDYGKKLNFRVAYAGEYGPNGCRPHYHCIFLGLTFEQLQYMLNRWKDKFGYTNYKCVPMLNKDGTNARQIVARYVGKYISKGKFDNPACALHDVQKGRLCNSKRFGFMELTPEKIAYYRAYDLYGEYDINTLELRDSKYKSLYYGGKLTDWQIEGICKEIVARSCINVIVKKTDGEVKTLNMPLPRAFKRQIWYIPNLYYNENEKEFKKRFVSPLILRKVSDYLRDRADADIKREFTAFCSERNLAETPEAFAEFQIYRENLIQSQDRTDEENDFKMSIFFGQRDNQ